MLTHEDLIDQDVEIVLPTHPDAPEDRVAAWHGTNSIGIISAVDNAYGVTGLAPEANVQVSSVLPTALDIQYREHAFVWALIRSSPGDVIMLELQGGAVGHIPGCAGELANGSGPIELDEPMWLITRLTVDTDIVVVAAAGNKGFDLDGSDPLLENWRDRGDSGAILVGEGSPDADHRWFCFEFNNAQGSCYGARVDLQGWGGEVLTLACLSQTHDSCIYAFGDGINQDYSWTTGTSGATPQVTGAVIALQGFHRDRFGQFFDLTTTDPDDTNALRKLLIDTGHEQGLYPGDAEVDDHHIGPYPNLRAAIDDLLDDPSVALPFDDVFPSTTIDDAKWPIATGVIDTLGDGEPSAPNSMHLGPGQKFETASMVTTDACTVGGTVHVFVSFFSQYGGSGQVPNGNLEVSYRTASGSWIPLRVIVPVGSTDFTLQPDEPASDGLHDAFRLRFESKATSGDWFVDDAHVDIVTVPEFRLTPFTQTVCEGQSVSFEVEVIGGGLVEYDWKKDGVIICDHDEEVCSPTYTITSASASDSGDYTAVATNECESTESTPGELTVDEPISLTATGPTQPVNCGTQVILSVAINGSPTPAIQWLLDDIPIDGATGTTYTIASVCPGDQGFYKVVAANSEACGGQVVESNPLSLDVDESGPACDDCPPVIMSAVTARNHGGVPLAIAIDRNVESPEPFTTESRMNGIEQLEVRFNQAMGDSAEVETNYSIVGLATGPIASTSYSAVLDTAGLTVTLTFPGANPPDRDCYTITLSAAIQNAEGDAFLVGDRDFVLRSLTGDANEDGTVDPLDFGYIQARFSLPVSDPLNTGSDINIDGAIDPLDIGAAQSNFTFTGPCP